MSAGSLCATMAPVIPSPTDNAAEDPGMLEARLATLFTMELWADKKNGWKLVIMNHHKSNIICLTPKHTLYAALSNILNTYMLRV